MQAPPLIALEIVLGFVVPIGWACWELYSLRRERQRDRLKADARALEKKPVAEAERRVEPPL